MVPEPQTFGAGRDHYTNLASNKVYFYTRVKFDGLSSKFGLVEAGCENKIDLPVSVPPTAVWISKKDQHLLSGKESTFVCSATGAAPKLKFTWYLNDQQLSLPSTGDLVS